MILTRGLGIGGPLVTTGLGKWVASGLPPAATIADYIVRMRRRSRRA